MKPLFQTFGVLLALYVAYAIATGSVVVKDRWKSKRVSRDEAPREFWICIAIYAALTLALLFIF